MKRLPKPQERQLLYKHLCGNFKAPVMWPTIRSLIARNMLTEMNGRLMVTALGRSYCNEHQKEIEL
jgi:hypothetical protein